MVKRNTEPVSQTCPNCELCGQPMPKGEEMFKYHGASGPCPEKDFQHEEDCPCFGDTVEHSEDCRNCTCETNHRLQRGRDSPETAQAERTVVSGNRVADEPRPGGAPTIRDAILLIETIENCDGMPAKLMLLRNFILFAAGRLSDWH